MSLFNKLLKGNKKTVNRAGGKGFVQNPKMELASILLTSFAQDQMYRSSKDTFKELTQLLAKVDPKFAAKAAIYARTEYGMRSITHVLAAELAAYLSGKEWAKGFYNKIVYRPDDMLEILAYFNAKGGTTMPNAMKKGFAQAFDRFDGYQLAKYRGERKAVKLIDVVNLVHPLPTKRNAKALQDLVNGDLKSTNTWESKLTKAGQEALTDLEKTMLKRAAWRDLILENKIGYFALLRNLRNILEQAPDMLNRVIELLTDENRIQKSLVLPFRYLTAVDALNAAKLDHTNKVIKALNRAIDLSLTNVPVFDGKTLVVLDDSGSMTHSYVKGMRKPIEIGAIFASILYKSNNADLMCFSNNARYLTFNPDDATMSIADRLIKRAVGGGTNFHSIFETANRAYDRVIILSDMQGWMGGNTPTKAFADYKTHTGANPYIYSFDLQGLGSLQFPEQKVFALAGFSDKVFDMMAMLEADKNALVTAIENVKL